MAMARNSVSSQPAPVRYRLRFLVEHEPWAKVFLSNFGDLFRAPLPPLPTTTRPGNYWADSWIESRLPWPRLLQSLLVHVLGAGLLYVATVMLQEQPRVVETAAHRTITDYQIAPYLPAINSAAINSQPAPPMRSRAQKADPGYSPQEIVSLQPDHNSTQQTVIQPELNILNHDVPLPNMMIGTPVPVPAPTAAAKRLVMPSLPEAAPPVAAPAEEAAKREVAKLPLTLPDAVAPPSPVTTRHTLTLPEGTAAVVPPAQQAARRSTASLNTPQESQGQQIAGPSAQIASRTATGRALPDNAPAVASPPAMPTQRELRALNTPDEGAAVAPPAPVIASGTGRAQSQEIGQLLALNANPAAPSGAVTVPEGNRRGEFSAGPDGHTGASGRPEIKEGSDTETKNSGDSNAPEKTGGPPGIYVAAPLAKVTGSVVGSPPVLSTPQPPHVPSPASDHGITRSGDDRRVEESVFNGRKYYSMLLSMPNLNSAGGSWTIRFTELHPPTDYRVTTDLNGPVALSKVDPAYPQELIHDRVEGVVVLYAVIHSNGSVDNVRVLEGVDAQLDENARSALQRWRFRPGTRAGVPVDLEAVIRIPFRAPRRPF
jgi:TonB family protein